MGYDARSTVQRNNGERIGDTTNSSEQKANRAFNRYQKLVGNNVGLYPSIVGFEITDDAMEKGIMDMLKANGIDDEFINVRVLYNIEYDKVLNDKRSSNPNPRNIEAFDIYVIIGEESQLIQGGSRKGKSKHVVNDNDALELDQFVDRMTVGEYKVTMAHELQEKLKPFMPKTKDGKSIFKTNVIRFRKNYGYAYKLDYNVCMRYFFGVSADQTNMFTLDVAKVNHRRVFNDEGKKEVFNARIIKAYPNFENKKSRKDNSFDNALNQLRHRR